MRSSSSACSALDHVMAPWASVRSAPFASATQTVRWLAPPAGGGDLAPHALSGGGHQLDCPNLRCSNYSSLQQQRSAMATPHLREREQSLRGWYKLLQVGCARVDPVRSSHTRAQRQLCSCTASNTRASTEHSTDKYFRGTVRNRPAAVRQDTQTHIFLLRPSSHATPCVSP